MAKSDSDRWVKSRLLHMTSQGPLIMSHFDHVTFRSLCRHRHRQESPRHLLPSKWYRPAARACPENGARLFRYLDIGYIRCLMTTCSNSLILSESLSIK